MPTELPENNSTPPETSPSSRRPNRPPTRVEAHDGGSFPIATVAGIPIRIHVTFLLLLAFLGFQYFGKSQSLMGILLIVAIFVCVILHELGHALTAQRYGIRTLSITLYPIGGVATLEEMPRPRQELWVALAGPAVNLVIAAVLYLYLKLTHLPVGHTLFIESNRGFAANLMAANSLLALFNMLPAFPMDGGRVLRAVIARFTDESSATNIAARIGQFMAVLFAIFGLFTGNFITLIIAVFIWFGAGQEAAYFQTRSLLIGHRVREAMVREFHTLPVGSTLREAANLLLASSQQDFPVVHGGDVVGVLPRSALMQGMASEGPEAYVASVMDRNYASVLPDDDLESLLSQRMAGPILVLKDGDPTDAALVGMITQENLLEFLTLTQVQSRLRPRA